MSKILVDTIDTRSGTSTLTLGSSNAGTIALGSGDVQSNFLYPAFHAVVGSNQSLSNNTQTKLAANSETFDSDGKYDNSAYRFTPTVAGKYICYAQVNIEGGSSNTLAQISIYKNGSQVNMAIDRYAGDGDVTPNVFATVVLDSDDYVEAFARHNVGSSKNAIATSSWFGAYRIGT